VREEKIEEQSENIPGPEHLLTMIVKHIGFSQKLVSRRKIEGETPL
jgi:hypothetical protein